MSLKDQTVICNDVSEGHSPWVITNNQVGLINSSITKDWIDWWNPAIQKWCPNRSCVLQAGGWQGLYPQLLSDHFEQVITIEPEPTNFFCLVNNCQNDKIIKMQAALGEECGWATLDKTGNSAQHRIVQNKFPLWNIDVVKQYIVPVITVDSLKLPDLGLLFLDIENHEIFALNGAIETLKRTGAPVLVEYSFLNEVNTQVQNLLVSLGYRLAENFGVDLLYVKDQ